MSRLPTILFCTVALASPLALGGCVGVLVAGGLAAAGGAGYSAAAERGVSGSLDDFTIKTNIESAWNQADPNIPAAFTVSVYDNRVLLTGRAVNQAVKAQANQIARQVPGIRALYDEIELTPGPDAWNAAQDAWITAQVRSELVFDGNIRSTNYTIDTANQSVYLIGSARSQAELDLAANHARYVPGVRRVVSYVEIRPGVPVAAQPAAARVNPAPAGPAAAPRTAVEVQKL